MAMQRLLARCEGCEGCFSEYKLSHTAEGRNSWAQAACQRCWPCLHISQRSARVQLFRGHQHCPVPVRSGQIERTVQYGLSQALNVVGGDPVWEGQHSGHMLRYCHLIHLHPQPHLNMKLQFLKVPV